MPLRNEANNLPRIFNLVNKIKPSYVVFCTNDNDDDTLEQLENFVNGKPNMHLITFSSDDKSTFGTIAKARQLLLEQARQLDCEYFICLDGDVISLTNNFVDLLMAHNKDFVGCCVKEKLWIPNRGCYYGYDVMINRNGQSMFMTEFDMAFRLVPVIGCGFHCVCLSKKLIKDDKVNFLPLQQFNDAPTSEDYSYCLSAKKQGYALFVDTKLKFVHQQNHKLNRAWRNIRSESEIII
jgi:glycosyltransferase involved in cell wall biosynthesis